MKLVAIDIAKQAMNFSIAHFTIFSATEREDLHGHNYQLECEVLAPLGEDGLVFDYGILKKVLQRHCDLLDEKTILPELSPHLQVVKEDGYVVAVFNGERIPFLPRDVLTLPIANTSVEAFAHYFLGKLMAEKSLLGRGIQQITVRVASSPGQKGIASQTLDSVD